MPEPSFRTTATRLQIQWASERRLPIGASPTRLAMPQAEQALSNFLTPAIGDLVRAEVLRNSHVRDEASKKLFGHPRLFDNLLSSQPMCFNLFGELALDMNLATKVFRQLYPADVDRVYEIRFEYSPGRRDLRYLGNRTAADAFVVHTTPTGGRGFIAIETKYVETMSGSGSWDDDRYRDLAAAMDAWTNGPPIDDRLSQITLDHMLALSMLKAADGWKRGRFLFAYPAGNTACSLAASDYAATLNPSGASTFASSTVEHIHAAIASVCSMSWVADFKNRYLG